MLTLISRAASCVFCLPYCCCLLACRLLTAALACHKPLSLASLCRVYPTFECSLTDIIQAIVNSFHGHFKHLWGLSNACIQFDVIFDNDRCLHALFVTDSHRVQIDEFHSHIWQECLNFQHTLRVAQFDSQIASMESFLPRSQASYIAARSRDAFSSS